MSCTTQCPDSKAHKTHLQLHYTQCPNNKAHKTHLQKKTPSSRDSSVGIATGYRLDSPGLNPGGREFFAHVQTGPWAHPASWRMGTGSFPGVIRPRGDAVHSPPSSAKVKKVYSYTSTPPMGPRICKGVPKNLYMTEEV
jgi:hypothetical protein